jgi:hypothetical protein
VHPKPIRIPVIFWFDFASLGALRLCVKWLFPGSKFTQRRRVAKKKTQSKAVFAFGASGFSFIDRQLQRRNIL